MATQTTSTTVDELLEGWRQKAWLQRLFLPGDFLEQVTQVGAENMVCHKTAVDCLAMSDEVEGITVRSDETGKYSTDLDYRPQEFKNETLKIIANAVGVACGGCSGAGQHTCGSCSGRGQVTCGSCSGRGEVTCDTTKSCGSCGGSGTRSESCGSCNGRGNVYAGTDKDGNMRGRPCPSCGGNGRSTSDCGNCSGGRVTCDRCGGRGRVDCGKCGRSGILTCGGCSGSGIVVCGTCRGSGSLVQAEIITRKFSHSKELAYQLSGLAENEFKNGLDGKHFKSMTGDLVSEEFQTPANQSIVLQRQSVHSYDVLSHRYTYRDAPFSLNRITSDGASKYVASGVPLSKTRTAIAGGMFFAAAAAVAALLIFL